MNELEVIEQRNISGVDFKTLRFGNMQISAVGNYFSLDDVIANNKLETVDINQIKKVILKAAKGDSLYLTLGIDSHGIRCLPPLEERVIDGKLHNFVRLDLAVYVVKKIKNAYGYLYGVSFGDGSAKIGCSEKPENRIKTIKSSCDKISTSAVISIPIVHYRHIEQIIHKKLKNKRIRGEWYILKHADVYQLINEIGEATKEVMSEQGPSIYFTDNPRNVANDVVAKVKCLKKYAG